MTLYVVVDPRHRDAAFPMQDRIGRSPDDLRIDIGPRAPVSSRSSNHDPQGAPICGAVIPIPRGVHGLEEVARKLAQRVVNTVTGWPGAQAGVVDNGRWGGWSYDLLSFCHCASRANYARKAAHPTTPARAGCA